MAGGRAEVAVRLYLSLSTDSVNLRVQRFDKGRGPVGLLPTGQAYHLLA